MSHKEAEQKENSKETKKDRKMNKIWKRGVKKRKQTWTGKASEEKMREYQRGWGYGKGKKWNDTRKSKYRDRG